MRYAGLKTTVCPICGGEVFRSNGVLLDADAAPCIEPIEPYHPATETLYNIRGEAFPAVTGDAIPDLVDDFPYGFRAHGATCHKRRPTTEEALEAFWRKKWKL